MANPSIVPPTLNVELDHALQQEVNFFLNWGYLVVDNAATPEQIESLRNALDESYERKNKSQFIGELLEEDDRFAFLLDNPPVLKRMEAILGTCVQLHSATARISEPRHTRPELAPGRTLARSTERNTLWKPSGTD